MSSGPVGRPFSAKAAGDALNAQFEADGLPSFVARIGIHFGDAVVGNVGSTERMNYTVLGNSVNLAARARLLTAQNDQLERLQEHPVELGVALAEADRRQRGQRVLRRLHLSNRIGAHPQAR